MTDQDFRHSPEEVENSSPTRYSRAGARVDRDPAPGDAARARFLPGHPRTPGQGATRRPAGAPGERVLDPSSGAQRYTNGQFAPGPLAERSARIRALGHAARAAAPTRRDEIAAGADYVRSGGAAADRGGVDDPQIAAALNDAADALWRAGDRITNVLRTWRPTP